MAIDVGLTHVALSVADAQRTIDFYRRYAGMEVVHERVSRSSGGRVAWLSDRTRPFVIVIFESGEESGRLEGFAHLGVGCESREEVDSLMARAREEGHATRGPRDSGYPAGYWGFIVDPDGHNLELSHGQEVGMTVEGAGGPDQA